MYPGNFERAVLLNTSAVSHHYYYIAITIRSISYIAVTYYDVMLLPSEWGGLYLNM